MNQLPAVPALGLTLAIPRERVQRAIEACIAKGAQLLQRTANTQEEMEMLKRLNWDWVLETCNTLKECFSSETVALYFASNVYFEPSLQFDDLARDREEYPKIVHARIQRLYGFQNMLPVVPEPPTGDFIAAQFHPKIYHASWRPFELAQYGQAVALAVKEIEDFINLLLAGSITASGADLVRKAFAPGDPAKEEEAGPLYDAENTVTDNTGIADLLAGFMGRYKALPPNAPLSIQQTSRIMSMASYLMYTLEMVRPVKTDDGSGEPKQEYEFEFLKD